MNDREQRGPGGEDAEEDEEDEEQHSWIYVSLSINFLFTFPHKSWLQDEKLKFPNPNESSN